MLKILALLALVAATVVLPACAHEEQDPNRLSTIPWNRPEKWEGQGPLGGMGSQ